MLTLVRHMSGSVAIDVHSRFEHAVCHCETYFLFRSLQQNEEVISLTKSDADQT
jgi:hypothetical protein